MNVFVTKKCGKEETSLSIEVDENSKNAQAALVVMNQLLSDFIYSDEPARADQEPEESEDRSY